MNTTIIYRCVSVCLAAGACIAGVLADAAADEPTGAPATASGEAPLPEPGEVAASPKEAEVSSEEGEAAEKKEVLSAFQFYYRHNPRFAYNEAGEAIGITGTDISKIPDIDKIGLKDFDIVTAVNDIPVTTWAAIASLGTKLAGVKVIYLSVLRDGENITIEWEVPPPPAAEAAVAGEAAPGSGTASPSDPTTVAAAENR